MKIISKTISINEFISRKNGVIPSLVDEWRIPTMYVSCNDEYPKEYIFNSYETAVEKINELGLSSSLLEYTGKFIYQDHNYGLVVSDVIIPSGIASEVTDYTDVYVNIPITEEFINAAPENLKKKYRDSIYFDLNNPIRETDPHYLGRKIVSGRTGQEIEMKILTYATLNKWYSFFIEYKDILRPKKNEETGEITYKYSSAIEYYESEYEPKNDANRKEFEDLDSLFNARGGNIMYNWIVENCMPYDEKKTPKHEFSYATNSASYTIPILLTTSIDDLGEMTIFSSKWKGGVDYSNKLSSSEGTVIDRPYETDDDGNIIIYNKTYVINGNEDKGYEQNEYLENVFNPSEWTDYTDYYINEHEDEFKISGGTIEKYAFSTISDKIIYNQEYEYETIPYVKDEFIIINGEYAKVIHGYYVEPKISDGTVADINLNSGKKIPVIQNGSLKYAEINGKKYYAVKEGDDEYIYFTNIQKYHDNGSKVMSGSYIIYNNNLYLLDDWYYSINSENETLVTISGGSSVKIKNDNGDEVLHNVLKGYFKYNGVTYYISNDYKVTLEKLYTKYYASDDDSIKWRRLIFIPEELDNDVLNILGWSSAKVEEDNVVIIHKLDTKKANVVTGYSESKLELLRRKKINTDELGNELPGYFELDVTTSASTNYNTPYDQCTLDLLYKVGEVSELSFQKTINENEKDVNLYNGNYLESITFYHLGENDAKIDEEIVSTSSTALDILKQYEEGGTHYRPEKLLYCDITYYINATLSYDEDNYSYVLAEGKHKGVKYTDTSIVTKTVGDFYMSDGTSFSFNYYELKNVISAEKLDDFKDVQLTPMSHFEMEIMNVPTTEGVFSTDYWEEYNGMISTPVFRTEYNLWSSTPQNIESNIYIDRGINAAFERHLKLQEIHTVEALENYGNSYFKINEY